MAQPRPERLLQLGAGAPHRRADFLHADLAFQVLCQVGAGRFHQRRLAAFAADALGGLARPFAPAGQQDEQVFQVDDQLLPRPEGHVLAGDRLAPRRGRGFVQFPAGFHQPVQVVLLCRLGVEHQAAEAVHGGTGAEEIHPQHFGRDLAPRLHAERFLRLVEQDAPGPQQDPPFAAEFLDRAAAHIDQLPARRLFPGKIILGTPFRSPGCRDRLDAKRKFFRQGHSVLLVQTAITPLSGQSSWPSDAP